MRVRALLDWNVSVTVEAWWFRRSRQEAKERRERGVEPITWTIIIAGSVAAALAVVALYGALVEKQAEPVEQIINPSP